MRGLIFRLSAFACLLSSACASRAAEQPSLPDAGKDAQDDLPDATVVHDAGTDAAELRPDAGVRDVDACACKVPTAFCGICETASNPDGGPCDWSSEICLISNYPDDLSASCMPTSCDLSPGSTCLSPNFAVYSCGIWTNVQSQ